MQDDLVERLRKSARVVHWQMLAEAADRITALTARLAALEQATPFTVIAQPHFDRWIIANNTGWSVDCISYPTEGAALAVLDSITAIAPTLRAQGAAPLNATLENCAKQFEFYEQQHRAKSPPQIEKAEVNAAFAKMCRDAIRAGGSGG